jgi:hypothetical protein
LSSILRALKKLENDARHLGGHKHLDNKFVPLADTGPRRRTGGIFIMVGGGIICGLVVLAGWYFFSDRLQPPPPETATLSSPEDKAGEAAPARPVAVNENPEKTTAETPGTKPVETVPAAAELKPVVPTETQISAGPFAETREEAPPAEPVMPEETMATADDSPVQESDRLQPAVALETGAPGNDVQPKTATVSDVKIPKLDDPEMNLQAITWSRVPQKRIAVINNRIVREGDLVSGYLVSTINQDDVVLSREGTRWRLLFR